MFQNPSRMPTRFSSSALAVLLGASVVPLASARAESARAESETGGERAEPTATKVEADTYRAEITAGGPYRAGTAGSVTVSLLARGGFHVNDQYPYRFKTSPPGEGVSYPKPTLDRSDGQFEEKTAVFHLPFIASHAGQFAVGGVLKLSVCSPTSCIVQKAPLAVTVTVQ